jgi:hypothetical protein
MHTRPLTRSGRIAATALTTAVLMTGVLAAPAEAADAAGQGYGHSKPQCRAFHAKGTGKDLGGGLTSATLFQGKREVGSSEGHLVPGVPGPDGLLPFAGTIVLTTWKGTLEAEVEGTFDTVTGVFVATTTDLEGKGPLRNATGKLRVVGLQDLVTGDFTEAVHARLCVPKKKQH